MIEALRRKNIITEMGKYSKVARCKKQLDFHPMVENSFEMNGLEKLLLNESTKERHKKKSIAEIEP